MTNNAELLLTLSLLVFNTVYNFIIGQGEQPVRTPADSQI